MLSRTVAGGLGRQGRVPSWGRAWPCGGGSRQGCRCGGPSLSFPVLPIFHRPWERPNRRWRHSPFSIGSHARPLCGPPGASLASGLPVSCGPLCQQGLSPGGSPPGPRCCSLTLIPLRCTCPGPGCLSPFAGLGSLSAWERPRPGGGAPARAGLPVAPPGPRGSRGGLGAGGSPGVASTFTVALALQRKPSPRSARPERSFTRYLGVRSTPRLPTS